MEIGRIEGANRVCGKQQGFLGLPVRDEWQEGQGNVMVTAWIPNPAEMAAIAAGAPIHIRIMGVTPQPMMVGVGEPPAE